MTWFVTRAFEKEFCLRLGVEHAIAVNSGTSALIAALWSLDLQPGDEVITSPFTFVATANSIVVAGGVPVFADIDPETFLVDPQAVESCVTNRTRAILPVHLFGQVCDMEALSSIARQHNLFLIEDAAQALGAECNGGMAGTLADAGCFSFYKTKNMSTFEGGMIAVPSRSRMDVERIRAVTNQGDVGDKRYEFIGFNFRMPEPCALMGLHQIKLHWPGIISEIGRYGIDDGYYPQLVYEQPAYRRRGIRGDCPVAERVTAGVRAQTALDVVT